MLENKTTLKAVLIAIALSASAACSHDPQIADPRFQLPTPPSELTAETQDLDTIDESETAENGDN